MSSEPLVKNRLKVFIEYGIDELETTLEMQRQILDENSNAFKKYSDLVMQGIAGALKSPAACVKNVGTSAKDVLIGKRKMDVAGKMWNLVLKWKTPEDKLKMRKLFVGAFYEIFRAFENQFMRAQKTRGGWMRAMNQLAQAAVWSFLRYFVLENECELTEEFIINGITQKLNKDISTWRKYWYSSEKHNTTVNDKENNIKWDPLDLFSKPGLRIETTNRVKYYLTEDSEYDTFGFRRLFSHEIPQIDSLTNVLDETIPTRSINYDYELDLTQEMKDEFCDEIFEEINKYDDSLLSDRLTQNMERIVKTAVDGMIHELIDQLRVAILDGTSHVDNTPAQVTQNVSKICDVQHANSINNMHGGTYDNLSLYMQ